MIDCILNLKFTKKRGSYSVVTLILLIFKYRTFLCVTRLGMTYMHLGKYFQNNLILKHSVKKIKKEKERKLHVNLLTFWLAMNEMQNSKKRSIYFLNF